MLAWTLAVALAAGPTPQVYVRHALLRAPGDGRAVGGLDAAPIALGPFRSPTQAALRYAGRRFELRADVDLADEATELEVRVPAPVVLSETAGFLVVVQAGAALPLVGGKEGRWVLGVERGAELPVPFPELPWAPTAAKLERGAPFDCAVTRVHAAPTAQSASWEPASFLWSFERTGPAQGDWTRLLLRSGDGAFTVAAYAAAEDVHCGAGTGGGMDLGLVGSFGVGDGFVLARPLRLAEGATLLTAADGGQPVLTLRRAAEALELEDGSVRLELADGDVRLSLHGLWLEAGRPRGRGPFTTHGFGSSHSRNDRWPRLPR